MRVALLTPAYGKAEGIVGRHVEALAQGITQAGGLAEVFVQGGRANPLFPEEHDGIRVTRFPRTLGRDYATLWHELHDRAHDFNLLHAHGEAALPALVGLERHGLPLIFSPHHYASPQRNVRHLVQGRHRRLRRQLVGNADRVLCVSLSEALQVARYAPNANIEIAANGIEAAAIVEAPALAVDGRAILTVDRLSRWAGIERAISALPVLPADCRVVVAGDGRSRGALMAHADYLGVSDRVTFLGAISDLTLHQWLRSAAVVVTLKEESLWGVTVLDSVAAGTPVVASDILAHREAASLVGQEGIRFVSRRASPFVVADAIEAQMAAHAEPRPDLVPSWEGMAEQLVAIYQGLEIHGR